MSAKNRPKRSEKPLACLILNPETEGKKSGRKEKKKANGLDFYETSIEAVEDLLSFSDYWSHGSKSYFFLDAGCGRGNIGNTLIKHGYHNTIGIDVDFSLLDSVVFMNAPVLPTIFGDFFDDGFRWQLQQRPDYIIENPPYSRAIDFITRSIDIAERGVMALLRLNFLESEKRKEFFRSYPPRYILVATRRYSFTEDGRTDATAYCWMIWTKSRNTGLWFDGKPEVAWIPYEPEVLWIPYTPTLRLTR